MKNKLFIHYNIFRIFNPEIQIYPNYTNVSVLMSICDHFSEFKNLEKSFGNYSILKRRRKIDRQIILRRRVIKITVFKSSEGEGKKRVTLYSDNPGHRRHAVVCRVYTLAY